MPLNSEKNLGALIISKPLESVLKSSMGYLDPPKVALWEGQISTPKLQILTPELKISTWNNIFELNAEYTSNMPCNHSQSFQMALAWSPDSFEVFYDRY